MEREEVSEIIVKYSGCSTCGTEGCEVERLIKMLDEIMALKEK